MQHQRKPIPEEHLAVVSQVFEEWGKEYQIDIKKLTDERQILAARIASWIDHRSVSAGVHDVMAFMPHKFKEIKREVIQEQVLSLAERLIKQIHQRNLLTASLRRGSGLGA